MKVTVFAYKGIIGIKSSHDCEGIIAHPVGSNLGVVCEADKVLFSPEAVELLKTIKKGNGSIGDIDIFQSDTGPVFCWLGSYLKVIIPSEVEGSRTYDPSLINSSEGIEVPENFIKFAEDKLQNHLTQV